MRKESQNKETKSCVSDGFVSIACTPRRVINPGWQAGQLPTVLQFLGFRTDDKQDY